jgi:hypothetical protein
MTHLIEDYSTCENFTQGEPFLLECTLSLEQSGRKEIPSAAEGALRTGVYGGTKVPPFQNAKPYAETS